MVLCALCIILALLFLKVALDFRWFILFYSNSFISEILIWDIQRSHFDFALSMSCQQPKAVLLSGVLPRRLCPDLLSLIMKTAATSVTKAIDWEGTDQNWVHGGSKTPKLHPKIHGTLSGFVWNSSNSSRQCSKYRTGTDYSTVLQSGVSQIHFVLVLLTTP